VVAIAAMLPGKASDPGRSVRDNRLFRQRLPVGPSVGGALARPAGALRQVEDAAQTLHALGEGRRLPEPAAGGRAHLVVGGARARFGERHHADARNETPCALP